MVPKENFGKPKKMKSPTGKMSATEKKREFQKIGELVTDIFTKIIASGVVKRALRDGVVDPDAYNPKTQNVPRYSVTLCKGVSEEFLVKFASSRDFVDNPEKIFFEARDKGLVRLKYIRDAHYNLTPPE